MSLIIGAITKNFGIIASDGRQFGCAKFKNDQLMEKAIIVNNEFNKTFSLLNGKIIGASAGTTSFEQKNISGHLEEIINEIDKKFFDLDEFIDAIMESFRIKLKNIRNTEILFKHRKIDMILIWKDKHEFFMHDIRFFSNDACNDIICQPKKISPFHDRLTNNKFSYQLFGDDEAQKEATSVIKAWSNTLNTANKNLFKFYVEKALNAGIKKAAKHPFGDEQSCGGKIFVKTI